MMRAMSLAVLMTLAGAQVAAVVSSVERTARSTQ